MADEATYLAWIPALLEGTLDPNRARELKAWMAANPTNRKAFDDAVKIWDLAHPPQPVSFDADKAWKAVKPTLESAPIPLKKPTRSMQPLRWVAAAAVIALLSWLGWNQFGEPPLESVVSAMEASEEVVLPDGTKVRLNKLSQIMYPKDFAVDEREVFLVGEAYFDVAENPEKPFVIHTGTVETRVLGTSFNLRAYPEESSIDLLVTSGRVLFGAEDQPDNQIEVLPNEAGHFDREEYRVEKVTTVDPNVRSWESNELVYDNTPFPLIKKSLERHFEVKIVVNNPQSFADCRFSNRFGKPDLPMVLSVLGASLNFEFDIKGDQVEIRGEGCPQ